MEEKTIPNEVAELQQALSALPKDILRSALEGELSSDKDGQGERIITRTLERSESFSGPIPPPQILQNYNDVDPGLANRIVTMAENEQNHRHAIESKGVDGAINAEKRGQNYALVICTIVVAASFGLIWHGHEISGSILASGTLAGLAWVFISGRKSAKSAPPEVE